MRRSMAFSSPHRQTRHGQVDSGTRGRSSLYVAYIPFLVLR